MSANSVTSSAPQCTICQSSITARSRRSIATLSCGHLFHLDCIGSQFNFHSVMECPNCNRIEEAGNWRFAAGSGVEQITWDDENDNYVQMHPSLPQYYMQQGFPNLHPQIMIGNPQPNAPGSLHPAFVPGTTQLPQNVWAPQPLYVPISSSLSFTPAASQGFEVGPILGYPSHPNLPYHGYIPAPGGHAVGSSSQARHQARPSSSQARHQVHPSSSQAHHQALLSSNQARHQALPASSQARHQGRPSSSQARHQARPSSGQARHQAHPPRNGWPIVQNIQVVQQQQPSASAAAQAPLHLQASVPTSHSHRGIGTSMVQGPQPSFNNQGRGTRHPFRRIMGYYANMMHGHEPEPLQNENDEDGVPTMHRFL